MDPTDKFKENYNKYIETRNLQMQGVSTSFDNKPNPKKRGYSPNKFYVLGIIAGLLIVGPVGAYLVLTNNMNQNNNSQVSSLNVTTIPASTVSEAQIDAEMQIIWGQYYEEVKNDPKLRAAAKANVIRQVKINQGLSENHINTSSIASANPVLQQQQKEDILKQKVLNTRTVDYAFVFVNPDSPTYQDKVAQITYSYTLLKKYIRDGKTMQEAYDTAKKDPKFLKTITLTNDKLLYENSMDASISKKLFTYKKGQTTNIINSEGGTFIIAQITDSNQTPFATLDDWLAIQK